MQHSDCLGGGIAVAPKTLALLTCATTVTVVTNSRAVPDAFFQTIAPGDRDVFVVFNRHRFALDERLATRTIWVHRLDEASGMYFGYSFAGGPASRAFHRLFIAGDGPETASIPAAGSYLSYRAALPALADYPIGRRIITWHGKIRRIVSPSTGFVLFALLDELQRRGADFRTRAIGVGREYNGWPGHDWSFERRQLRRSTIDFCMADGRPDCWYGFLDRVPYGLVRMLWKLRATSPWVPQPSR